MSATVAQKVDPLMVSSTIGASSLPDGNPSHSIEPDGTHSRQEQTAVRKKAPMKRVTFDLDVEIHTIPQRIPIYEKRPASHVSYPTRGHHPQAFLPRPLDLRGKDRHLLGTTSAKKIIDLFNLPSTVHNYPFSPKIIGTSPKRTPYPNAATLSSYPPTNSYPPRQPRMSRAAFNLKQLTSALGEQFDESVYEWDYKARARKQIGGSAASMASVIPLTPSGANSKTKTSGNEVSTSKSRHGNAKAAFSPSRIKTSPVRSPTDQETLSIDIIPNAGQGKNIIQPNTSTPHLSSSHLLINNSQHQLAGRRQLRSSTRRTPIESDHNSRTASPTKDGRSSSRCSTIDTYVIAEPPGEKQRTESVSPRSSSLGYRRKLVSSPSKKTTSQLAWESPQRVPESPRGSSTPRSGNVLQQQSGPGQPQWEILARPATLSSSSAQYK